MGYSAFNGMYGLPTIALAEKKEEKKDDMVVSVEKRDADSQILGLPTVYGNQYLNTPLAYNNLYSGVYSGLYNRNLYANNLYNNNLYGRYLL